MRILGSLMCAVWGFFCGRLFQHHPMLPVFVIVGCVTITSVSIALAEFKGSATP